MDSETFDGLARAVGERGEGGTEDREQVAALQRLIATKGSRRLALAGLVGAALLGLGSRAEGAEHPRQRLQGRTPQRNRKQRNRTQNNNNNQEQKAPGSSPWDRGRIGPHVCRQDKLFGVCSETFLYDPEKDARPCCNGMTCTATAGVLVTACQLYCGTDADCRNTFPNKALACRVDALVCPVRALKGEKCCVPR